MLGRTQKKKWSVKFAFSRAQQTGAQPRSESFYAHPLTPRAVFFSLRQKNQESGSGDGGTTGHRLRGGPVA